MKKENRTFYLLIAFGQLIVAGGQLFQLQKVEFQFGKKIWNTIVLVLASALLVFSLYKYFKLKTPTKK